MTLNLDSTVQRYIPRWRVLRLSPLVPPLLLIARYPFCISLLSLFVCQKYLTK